MRFSCFCILVALLCLAPPFGARAQQPVGIAAGPVAEPAPGAAAATGPSVAPGLRLSSSSVPWALDTYQGADELVPVHHANISLNRHTGQNSIAGGLAGPFYRPQMTTELAGQHAAAQLHSAKPSFYLQSADLNDPGGDNTSGDQAKLVLVPAKVEKNRRVVSQFSFNAITTSAKRKDTAIATEMEKLEDGWVRLTPKEPLPAGEYVLVPQPDKASESAITVFPSGVDTAAPEAKRRKAFTSERGSRG